MDYRKLWQKRPAVGRAAVTVRPIDAFNARGMRRAYGRRDHMGPHHTFEMDIWVARDGRVLMRCSSRCIEIEGRSFEITGPDVAEVLRRDKEGHFRDAWIPDAARRAYGEWIEEEY